jgi:hypothetical protein
MARKLRCKAICHSFSMVAPIKVARAQPTSRLNLVFDLFAVRRVGYDQGGVADLMV